MQNNEYAEAIYSFIKTYREENRKSPTIREIASACFVSVGTVIRYLDKLELTGRIQREPNQARSIILVEEQR
jgi:DNA-binding MarR family transcriptional regulator